MVLGMDVSLSTGGGAGFVQEMRMTSPRTKAAGTEAGEAKRTSRTQALLITIWLEHRGP